MNLEPSKVVMSAGISAKAPVYEAYEGNSDKDVRFDMKTEYGDFTGSKAISLPEQIARVISLGRMIIMLCLLMISTHSVAQAASCGRPDFDRSVDKGFFVWQNCGTGEWFVRQTAGGAPSGDEFRVEGSLQSSEPMLAIAAFNLESHDTFDATDPSNISFVFRAWGSAQDGFDFSLQANAVTCLRISEPDKQPIIIGADNMELFSPVNLLTLDDTDCRPNAFLPSIVFLLNSDQITTPD